MPKSRFYIQYLLFPWVWVPPRRSRPPHESSTLTPCSEGKRIQKEVPLDDIESPKKVGADGETVPNAEQSMYQKAKTAALYGTSYNIHAIVDTDATVHAIHAGAEKFEERVEFAFGYLQVGGGAMLWRFVVDDFCLLCVLRCRVLWFHGIKGEVDNDVKVSESTEVNQIEVLESAFDFLPRVTSRELADGLSKTPVFCTSKHFKTLFEAPAWENRHQAPQQSPAKQTRAAP
jgi:hypothetical protein